MAAVRLVGCSHPTAGTLVPLVDRPVSGYLCPLLAQVPDRDLPLVRSSGDGSTQECSVLCLHIWDGSGGYEVTATAADGRMWRGTIRVFPPQAVVDLEGILGLPHPEPEDTDSGANLILFRPQEQLVARVTDSHTVATFLEGIREAEPVTAGPRVGEVPQVFIYDRGGICPGMARFGDGVLELALGPELSPAGSFVLKGDPVSDIIASVPDWAPGQLWKGRVVPSNLPLSSLPQECLGIALPPATEASVVRDYGLAESSALTIAGHAEAWVALTRRDADSDYILALLAAAPPADWSSADGLPEDGFMLPWVTIEVTAPPGGRDVIIGLLKQGHIFWARSKDAERPEHLYIMIPELQQCLTRLALVLGKDG